MKHCNILDQARARLMWGEPIASVRDFLLSSGFSDIEADRKIEEFNAERNLDIRKTGVKKVIIGGILSAGAIFYFISLFRSGHMQTNYRSAKGAAVIAVAGFYGMWKFIDGLIYLARPQSETKCITEITE
jgi:hypothetical protein